MDVKNDLGDHRADYEADDRPDDAAEPHDREEGKWSRILPQADSCSGECTLAPFRFRRATLPSSRLVGDKQKSSPSRWRFRPPDPMTFRFRVRPPG